MGSIGLYNPIDWRKFLNSDAMKKVAAARRFFYVGAGCSMNAKMRNWEGVAKEIDRYLVQYEGQSSLFGDSELSVTEMANLLDKFVWGIDKKTGHPFFSRKNHSEFAFTRSLLLNYLFREPLLRSELLSEPEKCLSVQKAIWETHPTGVITTNYDTILEDAFILFFPTIRQHIRTYKYDAQMIRFILSNYKFILKLHGDINDIGRMVLNPLRAWDDNNLLCNDIGDDLKRLYASLIRSGSLIFVGTSFRDRTFLELHAAWRNMGHSYFLPPIALLPSREICAVDDSIRQASFLPRKFRNPDLVDDIVFLTWDDPREVEEFLIAMAEMQPDGYGCGLPEPNSLYPSFSGGAEYRKPNSTTPGFPKLTYFRDPFSNLTRFPVPPRYRL